MTSISFMQGYFHPPLLPCTMYFKKNVLFARYDNKRDFLFIYVICNILFSVSQLVDNLPVMEDKLRTYALETVL